jgi:ADP-ribose pyrophosphatase YjhB (NUDIX family)
MGTVEGDHFERLKCTSCSFVHYDSPKVRVTCLATFADKLLWIKRGPGYREGLWTQPGGFMEQGEQPEEAVIRELYEETQVKLIENSLELVAVASLPAMNQLNIVYRAKMLNGEFGTSFEAPEVGLFSEDDAPWDQHAYPGNEAMLRDFYIDHKCKNYRVYCSAYGKDGVKYRVSKS